MFVKPLRGKVPDPQHGGYLPPEGRRVEPGPYWWRRVADGDVIEAEPPGPPPDPAPAPQVTPTPQSPPTAGSSVSETTQPASRRKGAQP